MTDTDERTIRAAVREYIRSNFLYTRPQYALGDDVRLLDEGVMDSMAAVELVAFLQSEFGIAIPDDDLTEDNFGSIAAIARFVQRRQQTLA